MPRYHFNVHDGTSVPDDEGMELPSLKSARSEAVKLAGALLTDQYETFWNGHEWHMEVTDSEGTVLFTLTFFSTEAPAATVRI